MSRSREVAASQKSQSQPGGPYNFRLRYSRERSRSTVKFGVRKTNTGSIWS
jgi:hypothetical protein